MSLASGHEAHDLEGDEFERLTRNFPPYRTGLVRLSPGGWVFPKQYRKYADHLYNFEVRPTDVFLVTYPKVGTTWTQEILWTMIFNPDLDNPKQEVSLEKRSPFLDVDMLFPAETTPETEEFMKPALEEFKKMCPGKDPKDGMYWQIGAACRDRPRILKSHLPLSLLPPSLVDVAKVVYVIRNPADVITSYCHHCSLFTEMKFTGTVEEFAELFLNDDVVYSPYWLHVKEAWEKRSHPNMHILRFEDMKSDVTKELRKLNDFLGTKLNEKQLENVKKHTTFDAMKNRTTIFDFDITEKSPFVDPEVLKKDGGFFRQGTTGDGKKKLSPEMLKRLKEWCGKRFDFGLTFD